MKFTKNLLICSILSLTLLSTAVVYSHNSISYAQTTDTDAAGDTSLQQIIAPANANAQLNPTDAKPAHAANAITVGYNIWCAYKSLKGGECTLDKHFWTGTFFQDAATDKIAELTCGNQTVDDLRNSGKCIDATDLKLTYDLGNLKPGETYRTNGELGLFLASAGDSITNEPPVPTNLALFIDDTFHDTILPGQPAYAAGSTDVWQTFTLKTWKITRNIALALLGVFVGIAALMVMFRAKLDARATVTVYNILPMIPICLGLILLSYPLMSLATALLDPLAAFAKAVGSTISSGTFSGGNTFATIMAASLAAVVATLLTGGTFGLFILICFVVCLVVVIVATVVYIMAWIRVYVSLLYVTIFSPLIILMAIIPGKSGLIMNLVRRVMADILTVPVLILSAWIGFAIIGMSSTGGAPYTSVFTISGMGSTLLIFFLKFFIGISMIWNAKNARHTVEKMLGVGDLWGNDPPKRG